jgi:hypothetical protein
MMLGLFRYLYRTEQATTPPPTVMEAQRVLPPAPRLQTTTAADIVELRNREDEILRNYGWVDRNAGVVRLPIDRAMELIVERGLPQPKTPPAPKPAAPGARKQ